MKKITLALIALSAVGLSACSQKIDDGNYRGTVLFSQYEGEDLKLTIRKDNCEADKRMLAEIENIVLDHKYDSNIVTGACVEVSDEEVKNISRFGSSSTLSRIIR